jgi:hypothetical protein
MIAVSPKPVQTFRANSVDPTGSVSFTDKVIEGSLGEIKTAVENLFTGDGLSAAWSRPRWLSYPTVRRYSLYADRNGMEGVPFLLAIVEEVNPWTT